MIQKNNEIEILKENIFANDKLDRENTIKDLSQLLVSTHEPFVLSINANWGAGKTTFVKLWKAYLEKDLGVHSIYFSAWEDDFSKEPLIAIMGELNSYIENNFPKNKDLHEKLDELKNVSGKIIKRGLPAFIKGVTAGALDLDRGVESAIGAVTESVAKELIESYENDKAVTVKFKELLHDIIKQIDNDKPLIIFIDELDRCRPLYAIELLERLKHIFGIEKLIFVLSIDKKQLSESIKSQYGNIDTENYLQRFIDLEYKLANNNASQFCDYLALKFNLEEVLKSKYIILDDNIWNYLEFMKYILSIYSLSPREIEKIFIKLNVLFKTSKPRYFQMHFAVFVCMEILKTYNNKKYYELLDSTLVSKYFIDKINAEICEEKKGYCYFLQAIIEAIPRRETGYSEFIKEVEDKAETVMYLSYLKIVPGNRYGYDYTLDKVVKEVIKKLDFTDKFNFDTA